MKRRVVAKALPCLALTQRSTRRSLASSRVGQAMETGRAERTPLSLCPVRRLALTDSTTVGFPYRASSESSVESEGGVRPKFHASEVMFHGLGLSPFSKHYEMQYLKRQRRIDPFNPCYYKDSTMIRFRDFRFGNDLATDVKHVGKPATVWPHGQAVRNG